MSDSTKPPPLYTQKNVSLVSRAIQEFNKVSTKQVDMKQQDENQNSKEQLKGANIPKKRSVLGRGLSNLLSQTSVNVVTGSGPQALLKTDFESVINPNNLVITNPAVNNEAVANGLIFIPIDKLIPNPKQPRKEFTQSEIRELASSIRRSGLLQPILVRKNITTKSAFTPYEIIAGERRWRAAKEAGLIEVPAILKELNDRETLEIGIIENVQRQDLNPLEEAEAYSSLINDFGCTQEELSKIVSKDRSSISNTLRLLNLPEGIKKLVKERKISSGHARALLSLNSEEEQLKLAEELISLKLSVRDIEEKIKEKKGTKKITSVETQVEVVSDERNLALEERIRRVLGTKVKVSLSASGKGEVKISFFSRPEFETFLEKLGA